MAYSYVQYTGNSVATSYSITFPFISASHVEVRLGTTLLTNTVDYTISASTVIFTIAPTTGTLVDIRRNTPKTTSLVTFVDASILTQADLNLAQLQNLYIAQEALDYSLYSALNIPTGTTAYDAGMHKIINVASPTTSYDAVNLATLQSYALGSTPLPIVIANGGTGGTTAATARASLGAADATAVLNLVGGTMSGILNMGSHKITGLTSGASAGEAVEYSQIASLYQNYDIGLISRDVSLASGTSTITTTFQPKLIKFSCISIASSFSVSLGAEDILGGLHYSVFGNTTAASFSVNRSITIATGAGVVYEGYVSAVSSTSFTITWTRTGTPTGTAQILWEAIG